MFEFTPVCPYCAVSSAYPWVAQTSACGETKHVQAGPAYCPECGAVQDAAVDDENLSDIERRTGWRKTHE